MTHDEKMILVRAAKVLRQARNASDLRHAERIILAVEAAMLVTVFQGPKSGYRLIKHAENEIQNLAEAGKLMGSYE